MHTQERGIDTMKIVPIAYNMGHKRLIEAIKLMNVEGVQSKLFTFPKVAAPLAKPIGTVLGEATDLTTASAMLDHSMKILRPGTTTT